jgi:hypothetical protein
LGYFTFLKIDPTNQISCNIGAFNDNHEKILLMFMANPTTLYALSAGGIVRQWTLK